MFILERVEVVCFEAGLQVLIPRGMRAGVWVGWMKQFAANLARIWEGRELLRDWVAGMETRQKETRRREARRRAGRETRRRAGRRWSGSCGARSRGRRR